MTKLNSFGSIKNNIFNLNIHIILIWMQQYKIHPQDTE